MASSSENPEISETRGEDQGPGIGSHFDEEEDLVKLESDVKRMAEKIAEYRATLPDQLRSNLASILYAQRPVLPDVENVSDLGTSDEQMRDLEGQIESYGGTSLASVDQKDVDKVSLLKEKISSNISSIPLVMKRMEECIVVIEKLDSSDETIHPAFKRKRA